MTRRQPAEYNWAACSFDETILPASPRRITSPRRQPIKGITVHHMAMKGVGENALTACSNTWKTREASAHYGVADGFVRQYVWDSDEAWACANSAGNQTTLSIEHANSTGGPDWRVSDGTWKTGAKLVAHLCKLYGLGRPKIGVNLFQHKDWYNTACAGPYLGKEIWGRYEGEAQRIYDTLGTPPPLAEFVAWQFNIWKLTSPIGPAGHPKEFFPATSSHRPFYYRDGDYLVFEARVDGTTTSGTVYPRSEGREMEPDGDKAGWDSANGRNHTLDIVVRDYELPYARPQLVVGQIHSDSDDVVRLLIKGTPKKPNDPATLYASFSQEDGDDVNIPLGTVRPDQLFTAQIRANKKGIQVTFNGTKVVNYIKTGKGWYFKTGAYVISNEHYDKPEVVGRVSLRARVRH